MGNKRIARVVRVGAALALAMLCAPVAGRAQNVLPQNGKVVAGAATIGPANGKTLTIDQTSPRAIIDWGAFSIGPPNSVNFWQPSSSAAILNRVTGNTPSTIAGTLTGNGQVYLVNPNGIAITRTGAVSVGGGFVASTLDIANNDFVSGLLNFVGDGASAGVSNAGTIAARQNGFVALLGGTVANAGIITVPLGKVGLGSGERVTLDLNGGGFMQVAVPTGTTTADGEALVANAGTIIAAGGLVQMKAATVAEAMRDAVNMSGVVSANSVAGHNGDIVLSGGPGGNVDVAGKLDVSGGGLQVGMAPANGGTVIVDGAQVTVEASAVIDASGYKGGTVLVGASAPGGVDKAQSTTIAPGARILAEGDPSVANSGGYIETSGDNLSIAPGAVIDVGPGGTWLLDPTNLYITADGNPPANDPDAGAVAASVIDGGLASGNVTLTTSIGATTCTGVACAAGSSSSQSGDITVAAGITWSTGNTLTLSAYNNINIDAEILITGAGGLVLTTNNAVANANAALNFQMGQGSVQFTNTPGGGQALSINGNSYMLLYDMSDVQTIDNGLNGNYALAVPLDATNVSGWIPLGVDSNQANDADKAFKGDFEGLGNTISNLTVSAVDEAGLFGFSKGTIRDIGLIGGSVTGTFDYAGALIGYNYGIISNVYATGVVSGHYTVGGLVGYNQGTISNAYATGAISGDQWVAGLAGGNQGAISNAHATGAVSGNAYVGGLVALNVTGSSIIDAYATGAVTGTQQLAQEFVGGLVGYNQATIGNAYATGAVSGSGDVGGLVGYNYVEGTITNAYAIGAVTSTYNSFGARGAIGGLAGENFGAITNTYAVGAVSGSVKIGGLVGYEGGGTVTDGYYDANTTGQPLGTQFDGSVGVTTTALQAATLPTAFSNAVWGIIPNVSYPYLTAFFPTTPQVISGMAYQDAGINPLPSTVSGAVTVSALVNVTTAIGNATTGANGYFYFLEPSGTFTSSTPLFVYLNGASVKANAYVQSPSGNVTGLNLEGGQLIVDTSATSLSAALSAILSAQGGSPGSNFFVTAGGGVSGGTTLNIDAMNSNGFSFNQSLNLGAGTLIVDAAGAITETTGITAGNLQGNGGGNVTLTGLNHIGAVGPFISSGNFTLTDVNTTLTTVGTGVTSTGGNVTLIVDAQQDPDLIVSSPVNGTNVMFYAEGNITETAGGSITATNLEAVAQLDQSGNGGAITLTQSTNAVTGTVTLTSVNHTNTGLAGGAISFTDSTGFTIGAQSAVQSGAFAALETGIGTTGTTTLTAGGAIDETGSIVAGNLIATTLVTGGADILLDSAANTVSGNVTLTALDATGTTLQPATIEFTDTTGFTIASNGASQPGIGVDQNSTVYLTSSGGGIAETGIISAGDVEITVAGQTLLTGNNIVQGILVFTNNGASGDLAFNSAVVAGGGADFGVGGTGVSNPVGNVTLTAPNADIAVFAPISSGGTVTLSAGQSVFEPAAFGGSIPGTITAAALSVTAGGAVDLPGANAVATLAGSATNDAFDFNNAQTLTVGTVGSLTGITTCGTVTLTTQGNLTIASGATVTAGGGDAVLSAVGNFVNDEGSDAVTASGRWLIYSSDPSTDTFDNLDSANTPIWDATFVTLPPGNVTQIGNRYVFAEQHTLTVTTTDVSKVYGQDGTAAVANAFNVTGFQPGLPGVYLAENASSTYSGAPAVTSPGSTPTAAVSGNPYQIDMVQGSLVALNGYAFNFVDSGTLTVTPATLTYLANAASRTYGAANPTFSGIVSGFVNGETLTNATTGTLSFGSLATMSSGVGSYAIDGSGLTATNYIFAQASANATALTITPATLTYVANAASRTYGAANPTFGGMVTGFVNGDTLAGATSGTLSFGSPAMVASGVGSYAIDGSGLTAANYDFVQAAANATALTITPAALTVTANDAARFYGFFNPAFTYTVTDGELFNGDTLTGQLATTAGLFSPVGSYPIIQGTLAASANYVLTVIDGTLTVTPAPAFGASPEKYIASGLPNFGYTPTPCGAATIASLLAASGQLPIFDAGGTAACAGNSGN